jgi:hypothetical protein
VQKAVEPNLTAAAGTSFLDGFFDRFTLFTGALLYPAQQFIVLTFCKVEIIIRELGPFLFQLTFDDVPIAFNFEFVHNRYFRY